MDCSFKVVAAPTQLDVEISLHEPYSVIAMKNRQSRKIRELKDALATAGYLTLDRRAQALGLSRSTTWTVLRGNHKASGLSAAVINRILAERQLPCIVRAKILEYVEEKAAGLYGHGMTPRRKFIAHLSKRVPPNDFGKISPLQPEAPLGEISAAHGLDHRSF